MRERSTLVLDLLAVVSEGRMDFLTVLSANVAQEERKKKKACLSYQKFFKKETSAALLPTGLRSEQGGRVRV